MCLKRYGFRMRASRLQGHAFTWRSVVWAHCRAQKQAIDLESEIEAMEAEMERLSAENAEAAAARAALKAAQAEASELREQVRFGVLLPRALQCHSSCHGCAALGDTPQRRSQQKRCQLVLHARLFEMQKRNKAEEKRPSSNTWDFRGLIRPTPLHAPSWEAVAVLSNMPAPT